MCSMCTAVQLINSADCTCGYTRLFAYYYGLTHVQQRVWSTVSTSQCGAVIMCTAVRIQCVIQCSVQWLCIPGDFYFMSNHTLIHMEESGCSAGASQYSVWTRVVSSFLRSTHDSTHNTHYIVLYMYTYLSLQHVTATHLCGFVQGQYGVTYSAYCGRLDGGINSFHRLQHRCEPGVFISFSIY
jgi:hypothetical protein